MLRMSGGIAFGAALVLTGAPPKGSGQTVRTESGLVSGTILDGWRHLVCRHPVRCSTGRPTPLESSTIGQSLGRPAAVAHRREPHGHRC